MKLSSLKTILEGTGIPFAYHSWPVGKAPALPWGVYLEAYGNSFGADGIAYSTARHMQVELYTAGKVPTSEKKIEDALAAAGLYYQKTEETYLETEHCFETLYELEVLNDG